MKTLEAGYASHMAGGQTTTALCWRIRRQDGWVRGFTEHDQPLQFDGTAFAPAHGLDSSETPRRLGAQVDTSDVLGLLHADAITEDDIALGRFDGAVVETFRVNWRAVGQRDLLRRDSIGEIVREDGVFRAELRSGQQALNVVKGRVYQGLCDAMLGDAKCGIDLEQAAFRADGVIEAVLDRYRLAVGGLAGFDTGWFGFGHVLWGDGKRVALRDPVLSHRRIGAQDILEFDQAVGDWVLEGETLMVYAGCDRRLASCRDKFGNAVNFRGFPHIPGSDYVLRHPRHGDALDGRAVVR